MAEQGRCAHEGCLCDVPKDRAARGDAYCSELCAQSAGKPGHTARSCGCGHAGCAK